MIKLLSYKEENKKVTLQFENEQIVEMYPFMSGVFTVTSEGITKASVKQIKDKLVKFGITADLSEFINQEFKEYGE